MRQELDIKSQRIAFCVLADDLDAVPSAALSSVWQMEI